MATSGTYGANDLGNSRYAWIAWQLASQEVNNNRSLINWQFYAHFNNSDNQLDNGYVNSNAGGLWSNGGRVKNFTGVVSGHRDVGIASGSFWLGHNSAGEGSVQFSIGLSYYGTGRSEGTSGWWGLTTIPRQAPITNVSGDFNDETTSPWVEFTKYTGTVNVWFELPNLTSATNYARRNNVNSRYTWTLTEAEKNTLRSVMSNVNSTTVKYVVNTTIGSTQYYSVWERTLRIVNGEPVFTDFDYLDTNATTVAITGNDKYFIQNYSTLRAIITEANKASAQKQATLNKYTFNVGGVTVEQAYVSTGDINKDIGVTTASTDQVLTVTAVDSRGNTKAVTKTIKVVPYSAPTVTATAVRDNNFEANTTINISGVISLLNVAGTNKNVVVGASGVQYRYREAGGTWGSWTNRTSSTNATTGAITTTPFTLSLDNTKQWELEFRITDKLTNTTFPVTVDAGIPAFRMGADSMLYNKEQPVMVSHVGMVLMSTTQDTPAKMSAIYGGTWVAWGAGRVPVGFSSGETEFNASEKTGGAKTHTLNQNEMPNHDHAVWAGYGDNSAGRDSLRFQFWAGTNQGWTNSVSGGSLIQSKGGSQAHNNLQPYITVYMWKRTV